MKVLKKISLAVLVALAMSAGAAATSEGAVVVKARFGGARVVVRPARPLPARIVVRPVVRPARPVADRYVWVPGHCVKRPGRPARWIPGHWRRV